MAFNINCTNKGCGKIQSPYLDKVTNKVYCSLCDGEIENVSIFVKNQMKMNKQYKQREKKSFAVKCTLCSIEDRPKLVKDKIICSSCGKEMTTLGKHFATMLKMQLKNLDE